MNSPLRLAVSSHSITAVLSYRGRTGSLELLLAPHFKTLLESNRPPSLRKKIPDVGGECTLRPHAVDSGFNDLECDQKVLRR